MGIDVNVEVENARFAGLDYEGRFRRALELFGDGLYLMTSAGQDSAVIQYLAREALGNDMPPTLFIDTGFYPDSTHEQLGYLDGLCSEMVERRPTIDPGVAKREWEAIEAERYDFVCLMDDKYDGFKFIGADRKAIAKLMSDDEYVHLTERVDALQKDYDAFCRKIKGEPTTEAIEELGITAFVRGVRRDQSSDRVDTPFISEGREAYSISPIADMGHFDVIGVKGDNGLRTNNDHYDITKGLWDNRQECPLSFVI
jgi:3'-phosphoadenosine 5'-phosphosulfate sulfotransferase (PAPS reductase)/FAD synthetase